MSIINNIISFFRRPLMPVDRFGSLLDVAYDICDEDGDGYVSVWEIMRIVWRLWRMNV